MSNPKRKGLFGRAPNYDTPLDPQQETAFRQWAGPKIADTQDYDLRGAWVADARQAGNGHLPDTYKKPNHPTFSAESQYSTPDNPGGRWVEDGRGGWVFWATPANVQYRDANALMGYFNRVEPDSMLILPNSLLGGWNLKP
jgi:hypothetical protein